MADQDYRLWWLFVIISSFFWPILAEIPRVFWKGLQQKRARNWPSVQGFVKKTSIKSSWTCDDDGRPRFHTAKLNYSYSANGQEYEGQFQERFQTKKEASEFLFNLLEKPITVAYHPQKPSNSLIMAEVSTASLDLQAPANSTDQNSLRQNKEMPAWIKLLLWPLRALALLGFIASLWIHLEAIFGRVGVDQSWLPAFSFSSFPVMFLSLFIANRYTKGAKDKNDLKALWKDTPPWIRHVANGLTLYLIVDFIIVVFFTQLSGGNAGTRAAWQFSSALGMDMHYTTLVILYVAAGGTQDYIVQSHVAEER